MFTIGQIQEAHSKVKSGSDFPRYIQDLKKMGVVYYHTFVGDGHSDYFGADDFKTSSPGKYSALPIADTIQNDQFKADLKAHQQGQTDYLTFCSDCAKSGVDSWTVRMDEMTCTYYSKSGIEMLVEQVPG